MIEIAEQPNVNRARIALMRLERLGVDAEEVLPRLKALTKEHPDFEIRKLALETIAKIQHAMEKQGEKP